MKIIVPADVGAGLSATLRELIDRGGDIKYVGPEKMSLSEAFDHLAETASVESTQGNEIR